MRRKFGGKGIRVREVFGTESIHEEMARIFIRTYEKSHASKVPQQRGASVGTRDMGRSAHVSNSWDQRRNLVINGTPVSGVEHKF